MQKLSGTGSGKNNKSCGIFHHEPNKIEFAFFWFSTILYGFYKNQQNDFTIWDAVLQRGPWNFLIHHRYASGSRKTPWKEWGRRNWVPGARCGAGSPEFAGSGESPDRARGGGGVRAHQCSICGRGRGRGGSEEGAWRRRGRPAAGARAPASGAACSERRASVRLGCVLGRVLVGLHGWKIRWRLERGGVNRSR
jgi:hypothetical protein